MVTNNSNIATSTDAPAANAPSGDQNSLSFRNPDPTLLDAEDGIDLGQVFLESSISDRKTFFTAECDGFLFIMDGEVKLLNFPASQRAYNVREQSMVVGVVGSPNDSSQVGFPMQDFFADFLSFQVQTTDGDVTLKCVGKWIKNLYDTKSDLVADTNPAAKILKDAIFEIDSVPVLDEKTIRLIALPIVLPIKCNQVVIEGPVSDENVRDSVAALGSVYKFWIYTIAKYGQVPSALITNKDLASELIPVVPSQATLTVTPYMTASSLSAKRFQRTRDLLKQKVKARQLEIDGPSADPSANPVPVTFSPRSGTPLPFELTSPGAHGELAIADAQTAVKEKYAPFLVRLQLLGMVPVFDDLDDATIKELSPGVVQEDIVELCNSGVQKNEFFQSIKQEVDKTFQDGFPAHSNHFLVNTLKYPVFTTTLLTYFVGGQFPSRNLTSLNDLKNTISFFAFMSPPDYNSPGYQKYSAHAKRARDNETDAMVDQVSMKRSEIIRDTYVEGKQETLKDVTNALGVWTVFLSSFVTFDIDHQSTLPLMILRLQSVAKIVGSSRFGVEIEPNLEAHPWIPHSIMLLLHRYLAAWGTLLSESDNKQAIALGKPIKLDSIRQTESIYESIMKKLYDILDNQHLSSFAQPPTTFRLFFPNHSSGPPSIPVLGGDNAGRNNDRNGGNKRKRGANGPAPAGNGPNRAVPQSGWTGWLVKAPGVSLQLPSGLSCTYCKNHMTYGPPCSFAKDGKVCRFSHANVQDIQVEADQKALYEWAVRVNGLSLTPDAQAAMDAILRNANNGVSGAAAAGAQS